MRSFAFTGRGHPQVALEILDETEVRTYTRTSKSRPGWQFHWNHPVPDGTEVVILVDVYDPESAPKFSLVPVDQFRIIVESKRHIRPQSPDSDHCYVTPDDVEEWLNFWAIRDHI